MSPELLLLLLKALSFGPAAQARWDETARETVVLVREQQLESVGSPVFRGWVRVEEREPALSVTMAEVARLGGIRVRPSLRCDRSGAGGVISSRSALEVSAAGWRLLAGPLRGGMGSGLLVGSERWFSTGAVPRSAWRGVPTGLRTGPATDSGKVPVTVALRRVGREGVTLAVVDGRDGEGSRQLAAGYRAGDSAGIVVLASSEGGGVEVQAGNRKGIVCWRVGAAGWRYSGVERGSVVEAAVSGRSDAGSWEARIWSWSGSSPPLAPPVEGATSGRRVGLRFAAGLRPPGPLTISASTEVAGSEPARPRPCWWREQLELECVGYNGPGVRVRLRRTVILEERVWIAAEREERSLLLASLWSRGEGRLQARGELRIEGESNGATSRGIWIELDYRFRAWNAFIRWTYSLPETGIPLYWVEPGPVHTWRMKADRERGFRIVTGFRGRPEGLHCQLVLGTTAPPEILIGWRWVR